MFVLKPKVIPCMLRGLIIGLIFAGLLVIYDRYENPHFVIPIVSSLAALFVFIFTVRMSIKYDDEKIVIPSLMSTYSWNNLVKVEYIKESVKLTFNTPSSILRCVKISSKKYHEMEAFNAFLERRFSERDQNKQKGFPSEVQQDVFEAVQLVALIKNEKVPSMTGVCPDGTERVLFKRDTHRFEMHKIVYDMLKKHNNLDDIIYWIAKETEIPNLVIYDDEGHTLDLGLSKE